MTESFFQVWPGLTQSESLEISVYNSSCHFISIWFIGLLYFPRCSKVANGIENDFLTLFCWSQFQSRFQEMESNSAVQFYWDERLWPKFQDWACKSSNFDRETIDLLFSFVCRFENTISKHDFRLDWEWRSSKHGFYAKSFTFRCFV